MVLDALRRSLRARDLRQHEDRGGHDLRRQGSRLQSPVPADVRALPRRAAVHRARTNGATMNGPALRRPAGRRGRWRTRRACSAAGSSCRGRGSGATPSSMPGSWIAASPGRRRTPIRNCATRPSGRSLRGSGRDPDRPRERLDRHPAPQQPRFRPSSTSPGGRARSSRQLGRRVTFALASTVGVSSS